MIDLTYVFAKLLSDLKLGVYADDLNKGNILLDTSVNFDPTTSSYYNKDLYISVFDDGMRKKFDNSFGDISHNNLHLQIVGKSKRDVKLKLAEFKKHFNNSSFKVYENGKMYTLKIHMLGSTGCFKDKDNWYMATLNIMCGVWGS